MSGGSLNYAYEKIAKFAFDLREKLETPGHTDLPHDIRVKLFNAAHLAEYLTNQAKAAEWLLDGDHGLSSYRNITNGLDHTYAAGRAKSALAHITLRPPGIASPAEGASDSRQPPADRRGPCDEGTTGGTGAPSAGASLEQHQGSTGPGLGG
jgi:hypothetical protein